MTESRCPRTVNLPNRRTSMRLEPFFWDALEEIARREGRSVGDLCAEIDARRGRDNLTSAVRVFVTAYFRAAATEEGHALARHGDLPDRARLRRPEAEPWNGRHPAEAAQSA